MILAKFVIRLSNFPSKFPKSKQVFDHTKRVPKRWGDSQCEIKAINQRWSYSGTYLADTQGIKKRVTSILVLVLLFFFSTFDANIGNNVPEEFIQFDALGHFEFLVFSCYF